MAEENVQDMLASYVRDAHAMESNVVMMLDSMIANTKDEQILEALRHHKAETEEQEQRLARRLEEMGVGTTAVKDLPAMMGALLKGVADVIRGDKAGKNARDAYVTESMEIAAYRLLEELAIRAGDQKTATVARLNCQEEVSMRDFIDAHWGRFIDLTLQEEGVTLRG